MRKKVAQETLGCRYEPIPAEYDGTGEQADVWLLYYEDYAEFSLRLLDSPNRVRILGSLDDWTTIDDIIDFVLNTCTDYGIFVRAGYFELTKLVDKVTNNRVGKKAMKKKATKLDEAEEKLERIERAKDAVEEALAVCQMNGYNNLPLIDKIHDALGILEDAWSSAYDAWNNEWERNS